MTSFKFNEIADVDEFEAGYQAFRAGSMPEERFTPFRLQMGIYGQRQEGVQMVRIKLPGGVITPQQLEMIGDCVDDYAGQLPSDGSLTTAPEKFAHITTRQDIQTNFVALDSVPLFLRRLDSVGLTTREACGNTVRNVSSCFLAGRCPAEHADVSIHARRFAEFYLRHPLTQQFPRKFKVNFSGCATDCGLAGMHDIGFIAMERDGQRGFQVWAGGGLSTQPMGAVLLEEFVEESAMLLVGEALMRIHFKYSDRKRRARARMKYVVQKLGRDGFIAEYRQQRAVIEKSYGHSIADAEANWRTPTGRLPHDRSGVIEQHDGRMTVLINLFRGDLTPAQCHAVSAAARRVGSGELRVTAEQGIMICDIAKEQVESAVELLRAADLSIADARGIADVVACPGTESCRLGITASRGFAEAMRPLLDGFREDAALSQLTVKVSGCQHSCGRHHVADLGFHGLAKKIDGQAVPHYQLHIGGSGRAGEPLAFAADPVPAKRAPEAGVAVLNAYRAGRLGLESVHDWAERIGRQEIAVILAPFAGESGEIDGLIYDWSENEAFNTRGNKKGECAGAVLSLSDALISEAEYELLIAAAHLDGMFWADAQVALRRSAIATARAFLISHGEAPEDDSAVFPLLVTSAAADSAVMSGLQAVQGAMMAIDLADPAASLLALRERQQEWLKLASTRFAAVPQQESAPLPSADAGVAGDTAVSDETPLLDLSGVACPMNFVKTKIKLTGMAIGSRLQVILDDGAPIENVPLSLAEQGQEVESRERISAQQWKITVRKSSNF
ncbi:MAG: sulfurtransferase TusA family protein [Mariprofundales bacterium]|nr:sulfurtransferase TusA family protein [Mariprofundales bacterium]